MSSKRFIISNKTIQWGYTKMKKILNALVLFLIAILAVTVVNAQMGTFVTIDEVEFDDDELNTDSTNSLHIERGEEYEVKVHFTATEDAKEVEVRVWMSGYEDNNGNDVEDWERVDEIYADSSYIERLELSFPHDLDQDYYSLRVCVEPRSGVSVCEDYELQIEAQEELFLIKDVVFSPGSTVEAGRSLLTTVRVENVGDEDDEEGTKVQVSIPELGLTAADYIDEVDKDDSSTSEELYIRIPSFVETGTYTVEVSVTYDDGDETVTEYFDLYVVGTETTTTEAEDSKTVIYVGPESQDLVAGQGGAVYPITLQNAEGDAKTYVVGVEGYEGWGTVRVDPSNVVVVGAGETEAVYLFVAANEGVSGLQTFGVTINSGSDELQEVLLRANVTPGEAEDATGWSTLKKGLEVGLIVLVVLLVILGLIIAVNKLRGDDEDDDDQTYY